MDVSRFPRFPGFEVRGVEVRGWMFRGFEVRAPRLEVGAAGFKVSTFGGFKVSIFRALRFEVGGFEASRSDLRVWRLELQVSRFQRLEVFKVSM